MSDMVELRLMKGWWNFGRRTMLEDLLSSGGRRLGCAIGYEKEHDAMSNLASDFYDVINLMVLY